MLKRLLVAVSAFAVLLLVALSYLTAWGKNREEIARAQAEARLLRESRDSILSLVARRDSMQLHLQAEISVLRDVADNLVSHVAQIEQDRREAQLSVRQLRRPADLQDRLRQTFPEVAASDWGVTEVLNEREGVALEYLLVPLWFSETFIVDHQNAVALGRQRDSLLALDAVRVKTSGLQDSVLSLERQNRHTFQTAYNDTYARYLDINGRYVQLLQRPPSVKIGLPKWQTMLVTTATGAVGGFVLATQVR